MQAVSIYRKVQQKFPDYERNSEAQYYLGYCYEKAGKEKMAMAEYEKFIAAYPDHSLNDIAKKRLSNLQANAD